MSCVCPIGERLREKTPSGGVKRQHCQGTKRFHRVKYKQTFWGLEWPPLGPGYSPMAQNTQINQIYDSFNTEVNISTVDSRYSGLFGHDQIVRYIELVRYIECSIFLTQN